MNRLAGEASLYLRQHAENPVDWFPWGEEAFARARERECPVLLSIGYSACHWCHVMAHESFENPETAAVMNELFVNVKVDREERPDVDALYMQATLAMAGHGGWPMTVWLTPGGEPFYAGTYFPPEPRQGMPGFVDVCRAVENAYRTRRGDIEHTIGQIATRLTELSHRPASLALITQDVVFDAVVGLARAFDPRHGGFGGAPKFPPSLALDFLLRRIWQRRDDLHARDIVALTLVRMAEGGIYDQLGGGFHRYSVDDVWLVPHFEKMLYDNALLAGDYALWHRITGEGLGRQIAEETLDYLLREMRLPEGAFASAQDADSPGGEGAYFVWTPEQLAAELTPAEAQAVTVRCGVTPQGNFEGRTILHVQAPMDLMRREVGPDAAPLLASARAKLLAARSGRPAPARDDKAIASWNGLAIAALADAGSHLGRPDFVEAAERTAAHVLDRMVVDGRLRRTWMDGQARHLACLDDYANVCHGLLALYAATFTPRWLAACRDLAEGMLRLFHDDVDGGFFLAGSDGEQLIARTREVEDHPGPSGNSQAAWVLLRLADLTGERELEARALGALRLVAEDMARFPQAFGTALVAADYASSPARRQIAVVGAPVEPATAELVRIARAHGGPHAVIAAGHPDDAAALAAAPLLVGKALVDGGPAAYVCRDFVCLAPVTEADALLRALDG